jgi:adenylate cyclase
VPISDVILNWDTTYRHGDFFKDQYVFIGALAPTRFKDYFDTPFGNTPGVEVQATAFENLINREWLRPAPGWVPPLLAILFGLLALFVSLRIHSVLGKIGLLIGLGVAFVLVTQWLFTAHLLMIPVLGASLGLVGCGGFGTVYDFMLERYERRRMLGVFESMVSPGVANLVLSNREDFEQRLGGQRKDVVILFTDIRGFTTWSEKVGPDALVTQLNEYFYGMVEVIQQEGGTVQKYIGDALMAAWGDVYERPHKESATQAVRAALRMNEELKKLNANWVGKTKREQLAIGSGINLGEGVVGRIGHPRRQEFTVMGDAVNLAARLESATKQYHQSILVGEKIYELAHDQFDFRLADKMQVKGKTFAVSVYAPLGPKSATPPPGLAEYNAAVEKYYARDFPAAEKLFQAANEKMGGADYLCENFISRGRHYLAEPPPPDWDGGWVLKDK